MLKSYSLKQIWYPGLLRIFSNARHFLKATHFHSYFIYQRKIDSLVLISLSIKQKGTLIVSSLLCMCQCLYVSCYNDYNHLATVALPLIKDHKNISHTTSKRINKQWGITRRDDDFQLLSPSLCNFFHLPVTFSFLGQRKRPSYVLHPCKTTGKSIVVYYILIFFGNKWKICFYILIQFKRVTLYRV
jgi:hypothetical protein